MAVYIDDNHLGPDKMCHMFADTTAELVHAATVLGMNPSEVIRFPGAYQQHVLIPWAQREAMILAGATPVSMLERQQFIRAQRQQGHPNG